MKEITNTNSIISLMQRALELTDSNRAMKSEIECLKEEEAALNSLREVMERLLTESQKLQTHLKELSQRALIAREDQRKTLSLALQEEIVQALAGIHIRLLTLHTEVSAKNKGFHKEIAMTRRLIKHALSTPTGFVRARLFPNEN